MTYWTPYGKPLSLPMICAPMFLASGPDLVIAQCKAGVVGSLPALNARTPEILDEWLDRIAAELAAHDAAHPERPAAPYAVNLIVHGSNQFIESHVAACVRHRVPVIITSLGAKPEVNSAIHSYGGIVLHDVINLLHARKAIERGADGLIAVAAGAGGHAGALSPFALIQEIRDWFNGPLMLSGAIATGQAILAAQVMGADLAYCGTSFIAADEAAVTDAYKDMVLSSTAADIVYTDRISGTMANFLKPSLQNVGIDLTGDKPAADYGSLLGGAKAWRDIWSAGHGVGSVRTREPAARIVERMITEYRAALGKVRALNG